MKKFVKLLLIGIVPLMTACASTDGTNVMTLEQYCNLPENQRVLFRAGLIVAGVLPSNYQSVCAEQPTKVVENGQ